MKDKDALYQIKRFATDAMMEAEENKRKYAKNSPEGQYWQGKADALRVVVCLARDDIDTIHGFSLTARASKVVNALLKSRGIRL